MTSSVTDCHHVEGMLSWATQILRLLPASRVDFTGDLGRYVVASLFINFGEDAKRVSDEARNAMNQVPWR